MDDNSENPNAEKTGELHQETSDTKEPNMTGYAVSALLIIIVILVFGYCASETSHRARSSASSDDIIASDVNPSTGEQTDSADSVVTTPSIPADPVDKDSWGYRLAAINDDSLSPSSSSVAKANRLLSSLGRRTTNTEQEISDMSVLGWKDLKRKGVSIGLLELMEKVDKVIRDSPSRLGTWEYGTAIAMVMACYLEANGVH